LLLIAVGIKDVYVGDVDKNGYDDIVISTTNNQLRTYLNKGGIFDVDGNLVCLNTNVEGGEISTTPGNLSGVAQIFLEDMDKDEALDIITNDLKGFVTIFYGGKTNGYANYLSKEVATCDTGRYERQKDATTIVTRYGIRIDEQLKIVDNSMVHRYGLQLPDTANEINEKEIADLGITIPPALLKQLED
jgi:hypothetical protein